MKKITKVILGCAAVGTIAALITKAVKEIKKEEDYLDSLDKEDDYEMSDNDIANEFEDEEDDFTKKVNDFANTVDDFTKKVNEVIPKE